MANPKSPYADQRQNLRLVVIWFVIFMGGLGVGAYFLAPSMAQKDADLTLPLFCLIAGIVIAAVGFPVAVKPLLASLDNHNDFSSDVVKGKIITAGAIYELPAIAGLAAWAFFNAWWVFAIGMAILASVVFFVLVPSVNKLYDFLELQLQRKEDGGTVAVAKKTTYDL
ncbi:hypothetical protein CCB80_05205 [Armatimonadetes bacterium Uphvl-Ar1]|nr:hypothetical protein CCB80_05205 [Armatimonadetes bacterium Uphvl-Ar1]